MLNQPNLSLEDHFSIGFLKKFVHRLFSTLLFLGVISYATAQNSYCVSRSQFPSELYIQKVIFESDLTGTIENTSTFNNQLGGYQDFTNLPNKAQQYPGGIITVKAQGNHISRLKAWIDWNKSSSFEEPLELVYNSNGGVETTEFSFYIPESTSPGIYRIRIRNNYGIYFYGPGNPSSDYSFHMNFSSCEKFGNSTNMNYEGMIYYGESEDYEFEVLAPVSCYPPLISSATNITHTAANLNWIKPTLGADVVSYDLEWNESGVFDGIPEATTTATAFQVEGLQSGQTYHYRVRANCQGAEVPSAWTLAEGFVAGGYTPLEVSGFNQDVIADGSGTPNDTTTACADGSESNFVWAENGSVLNSAFVQKGLPKNRVLKNSDGTETPAELKYYLQDYSTANSLKITDNQTTSTLMLTNPMELSTVYLAATGSNGQPILNIEVVYESGDNDVFQDIVVKEWSEDSPYIASSGSYIKRNPFSTPVYFEDNPRIFQISFENLDQDRKVSEIRVRSINSTTTNNIANIYAVSAAPAGPKILSVFSDTFCSGDEVTISATAQADINWYLNESDETPVKTTHSGESWNPEITETTSFYLEGDNGIVKSNRVEMIVTSNDVNFIATNGNWSASENWEGGNLPTADNCVRIPAGKTVQLDTDTAFARNLTVEDGAEFTLLSGSALTVTDFVHNGEENQDNFIVENLANLIQINNEAENSGAITLKKKFTFSEERKQYNFAISPLIGQNLKQIYPGSSYALRYDEATDLFKTTDGGYIAGRGLAMKEGSIGNGDATFKGVPFNGELTYYIEKNEQGYNLIGNPYPSAFDLRQFYFDNDQLITPDIQFWDNRNNEIFEQQGSGYNGVNYAIYNALNNSGIAAPSTSGEEDVRIPNGKVNAGGAFLVKALQSGDVHFNNSLRIKNNGHEYYGKPQGLNGEDDRFWLTLRSPSNMEVMTAMVYFEGGRDEYWLDDSDSLGNSDDIFTMAEGHQVVIQGRAPFRVYDEVPLGYRAYQEGTYIITVYDKEGVFSNGQSIYLYDKVLNKTVNLSSKPYKFNTRAGEFINRFKIVYKPKSSMTAVSLSASNAIDFAKINGEIVITSSIDEIVEVEVFDLNSRPVYSKQDINKNKHKVGMQNFGNQIIVVVVKTKTGEIASKKFINN